MARAPTSAVAALCAVMLGVTVANTGLGVVRTISTNRLGQDVLRDLRVRLYAVSYTHLRAHET